MALLLSISLYVCQILVTTEHELIIDQEMKELIQARGLKIVWRHRPTIKFIPLAAANENYSAM